MRYSFEFKCEAVKLYKQGRWPETPEGLSAHRFHKMIRQWVRTVEQNSFEVLRDKNSFRKNWSPEEKKRLVQQVISGRSNQSAALEAGIDPSLLSRWVRKYKEFGYNGLVNQKKGHKAEYKVMKKMNINNPNKPVLSEQEEIMRLKEEIEYLKSENAVIKKEIALREERQAAQLKAKKQQSSKNSVKKDMH